jgi:two-component system, LuxR family, sensor kinase FixL
MLAVSGLAIGLLVSERAEDERRLRAQQDALAHAARLGSMGEFAGAIAHEINQPLTAAGNYARAALSALKPDAPRIDDARVAAEKLVEQVERSAQVIRRLRELIRAGRLSVASESVEHLMRESLDLMRPVLHRSPVEIGLDIEPQLPLVAIDLIQIEQVVTNLVRNAVDALLDHQTKNPRVTLSARRFSDRLVRISVVDNGPGFPADFDIGTNRALASPKPDGLGVGLSLCQSILAAHGGQLKLENRGGGAMVSFTLPVANEEQNG